MGEKQASLWYPADGIAAFPITLPNNPLKWLNCYVILSNKNTKNLLIDTGFNMPQCQQELLVGMQRLNLTPENTDVFMTHAHADHTGNASILQAMGYRLIMGRQDLIVVSTFDWDQRKIRVISEGMSETMATDVLKNNPAIKFASASFTADIVEEGDILSYGAYRFHCICTPGHTPGHMCLYDPEKKLLLTGDHVLFDITPNINTRGIGTDALGDYLCSLNKIKALEVDTVLPAHRTVGIKTLSERIDELIEHHRVRLTEAAHIVQENPGINAYDIAGQMTWKIRSKNWNDFPLSQKWFAMCEGLAHLDHLEKTGRISRNIGPYGYIYYDTGTHI